MIRPLVVLGPLPDKSLQSMKVPKETEPVVLMVKGPDVLPLDPRFTFVKVADPDPVMEALSPVEPPTGATLSVLAVTVPPVMPNETPVAPFPTVMVLFGVLIVPPETVKLLARMVVLPV